MEGSSNQAPIDIENGRENPLMPLVTSMRDELDSLSPLSPDCCIYRVPERLREGNEKSYTPKVISIGPLHHGKDSLKAMEKHKKRYLRDFLRRTWPVTLEDQIRKVKDQEVRLRSCYEVEEAIEFSSDEFVRIILVDAAFIIELLLRFNGFRESESGNDRIFHKPWMLRDIGCDILLLENQLPFFILKDLFDPVTITSSNPTERPSIINLAYAFLNMAAYLKGTEDVFERLCSSLEVDHFVDFIRTLHLPLFKKSQAALPLKSALTIPSITKLHQAGVKFKAASSTNIFDIRFTDGILEIPKMTIHDDTELIIRNLLAFEQCHCIDNYICDYVVVLDDFVDTPKDVELLAQEGIVDNVLGDNNQVSILINHLASGGIWNSEKFYYATLYEDLNNYCKTPHHKWKANLRQKYFNTPWASLSVIAAVLLLIFTLIQTICSVISVS